MGCCLSTGDHPRTEDQHSSRGAPPTSPPATLEEETVKEVLLETPVIPKAVSVDERIKEMPPGKQEWKVEVGPTAMVDTNTNPPRKATEEIISEISEVSEMCSYSESFSNTTAQEKKDDDEDGEVNQRPPPRKRLRPTGGRGRGERVPARRPVAPSPDRRGHVVPLRPGRGRPMAGQQRNVAEDSGRRRDPGEGSCRRSRSPVRRGEICERPRSPVRRGEIGERRSVNDDKSTTTPEPPQDTTTPEPPQDTTTPEPPQDVGVLTEEAESLENPVVSLECFIFL